MEFLPSLLRRHFARAHIPASPFSRPHLPDLTFPASRSQFPASPISRPHASPISRPQTCVPRPHPQVPVPLLATAPNSFYFVRLPPDSSQAILFQIQRVAEELWERYHLPNPHSERLKFYNSVVQRFMNLLFVVNKPVSNSISLNNSKSLANALAVEHKDERSVR